MSGLLLVFRATFSPDGAPAKSGNGLPRPPADPRLARSRSGLRRSSPAQSALGRGDFTGGARIDRPGGAQRPRQTLKARFRDMVVVGAVQCLDVERDAGIHRE